MKRKLQVVGALIAIAVALAACSSSKSAGSTTTTAAPAASSTTGAPATTGAPTTSTTAGPTMKITPSTGLTNMQAVTITATGFPPNYQLGVTECSNAGAKTVAGDCNLGAIVITTTNSEGDVAGYTYHPALGPFGQDNIVCTKAPGCIISLAQAGSADPKYVATATVSFS
jgi:hypothetical protein